MEKTEEICYTKPERPKGFGVRHAQALLLASGLLFAVTLRTNMSVAIIAMTDKSSNPDFEVYDWTEDTKGLILSSYFWGYIITQIPAGILTHMFDTKLLLLISLVGSLIFSLIIPIIGHFGWVYVCTTRVFNGMFQGFVFPAIYTLMARWIHPSERALSAFILAGNTFGVFFTMIVSGQIAASPLGWPGIFYISGGLSFLWCILWMWLGSEKPGTHKTISYEEQRYIENSLGTTSHESLPIPWSKIITSVPYLVLLFVHCTQNWGFFTLMTETPTYIKNVLKFDIKQSSMLASLPYLVMASVSLVIGPLSDFLINQNYLSRASSRKLFNSFGHWGPAICLILLAFLGNNGQTIAISLLILALFFNSGCNVGFYLNYMDLSPNFSGTLYAISNCISNIFSLLGPMLVGYIVNDPKDSDLWKIVFLIAAAFFFLGNILFVFLGQANIQKWNNDRSPAT